MKRYEVKAFAKEPMRLTAIIQGIGIDFLTGSYCFSSAENLKNKKKEKIGYSTTLLFYSDIDLESVTERIKKGIEEKKLAITDVVVREVPNYERPRLLK